MAEQFARAVEGLMVNNEVGRDLLEIVIQGICEDVFTHCNLSLCSLGPPPALGFPDDVLEVLCAHLHVMGKRKGLLQGVQAAVQVQHAAIHVEMEQECVEGKCRQQKEDDINEHDHDDADDAASFVLQESEV